MRQFQIRKRIGEKSLDLLDKLIGFELPFLLRQILINYSGLSIEQDYYIDKNGNEWILAAFDNFNSIYKLTTEFKDSGWGNKIPFGYDEGGWHFCLSFDEETFGKVLINRWTDHLPEDQFVIIADYFEEFIDGLHERPEHLK
ncbi:MAG TPA: SMI1/KNR4 family protein [Leadbetterella sp.]|nr:SMI1/KNR4 family protein [Leadbetterella sp.]